MMGGAGGGGGISGMMGGMSQAFKQPDFIPFPSLISGMSGGQTTRSGVQPTAGGGNSMGMLQQLMQMFANKQNNLKTLQGAHDVGAMPMDTTKPTSAGISSMNTGQGGQGVAEILRMLFQAGG